MKGTHGIFGKGQAKCLKTYSSIFRVHTLFSKKKKKLPNLIFKLFSEVQFQSLISLVGMGGRIALAWITSHNYRGKT